MFVSAAPRMAGDSLAEEGQHACVSLQEVHETEAAGSVQASRPAGNAGSTWAAERSSCKATGPDPLLATLSTVTAAVDASGLPGWPSASLRVDALQLTTQSWVILTGVASEEFSLQMRMLPLHSQCTKLPIAEGCFMSPSADWAQDGGLLGSPDWRRYLAEI